ncbi:hypothetical protein AGMMS50276_00240 [Synergistales bacterium]|nr:hypothetical protein AGMMS50276_00240 [Synergistales bacterium]
MTQLIISLYAAPINLDGKGNGPRKSIESFVSAAVEHYRSEIREKGEDVVEWKIAEKDKEASAFLLVGTPKSLKRGLDSFGDTMRSCVAVLPDNQWDDDLNNLLQSPNSNVLAVIRGQKALGDGGKFREEDILQFSEILKSLSRQYARAHDGAGEEKLSKSIDWKCKIPDENGLSSFFSFFSDPAMTKMGRELKAALLDLDIKTSEDGKKQYDDKGGLILKKVHSVLLLGETGTGKTLAAEWISGHLLPEEETPMVSLNMATLPHNMVDVELFGSVPGAYTGVSDKEKDGILKTHEGKVIFLDEIGEMEFESQARLLKYLDCGEVRRVGGTEVSNTFSVIVAATNRPWDQLARMEGAPFHADLFYRFDHVIKIPSLKERKKDMRLLISLLLQDTDINKKTGESYGVKRISIDAIECLENASYPGNFRDLRGRIRTAVSRAASEGASVLCLRHLI